MRDMLRFPDDATGDHLWQLARAGDPLIEAREVTFTIDFPTLTSVAAFLADLEEVFPHRLQDHVSEQTLDVTVVVVPDHATVSTAEAELKDLAEVHGAEMMGWG